MLSSYWLTSTLIIISIITSKKCGRLCVWETRSLLTQQLSLISISLKAVTANCHLFFCLSVSYLVISSNIKHRLIYWSRYFPQCHLFCIFRVSSSYSVEILSKREVTRIIYIYLCPYIVFVVKGENMHVFFIVYSQTFWRIQNFAFSVAFSLSLELFLCPLSL